jgi:hypothetical protein
MAFLGHLMVLTAGRVLVRERVYVLRWWVVFAKLLDA